MCRRLTMLIVLVVVAVPTLAAAQPLADRVPADAVIYVGWRGSREIGAAYEQSHLKGVLAASDLPALFDDFLPRALERLGKEDPHSGQIAAALRTVGARLWSCPTAFYFGGIDFSNPNAPMPRAAALIIDAGDQAQATVAEVKQALDKAGAGAEGGPARVEAVGKVVVITIGPDLPAIKALLGVSPNVRAAPLTSRQEFKDAAAQVTKDPVLAVYVDIEAALKLADQVAASAGDEAKQHWPRVRDALGLAGAKRLMCAGGFDGKEWTSQMFLAAPAPRQGLLAMLDGKPVSDQFLKVVPKSATWMMATRCDAAGLVGAIRQNAGKIEPQAGQAIDGALAQAKGMTGVDLQADLLEPMGDEWAIYLDPVAGSGGNMLGYILVNRLDKPEAVQASLTKIETAVNKLIAQQMGEAEMRIAFRQTKSGELNIHYLAVPFVAPAWAVKDGNLYVALYPQGVASAAAAGKGQGPSILDNAEFQAMRKRLGAPGGGGSAISFMDLPKTSGSAYPTLLAMTRLAQGFADMAGLDAPPMLIPPLHELQKHLAPAGAVSWVDEAGWHSKSISPFPGSEVMATESNAIIGQQAMLISILLPALNAAKERANRVKCASNLKQIGMGAILYANDHKNKYPATLGELAVYSEINWEVMVCPTPPGHAPPPPDVQADKKKLAAWIDENADYVYLGAKVNPNGLADTLVAYEKPGNHEPEGMNLLYNDGHVDWAIMGVAEKEIEKATGAKPAGEQAKPRLPKGGGL